MLTKLTQRNTMRMLQRSSLVKTPQRLTPARPFLLSQSKGGNTPFSPLHQLRAFRFSTENQDTESDESQQNLSEVEQKYNKMIEEVVREFEFNPEQPIPIFEISGPYKFFIAMISLQIASVALIMFGSIYTKYGANKEKLDQAKNRKKPNEKEIAFREKKMTRLYVGVGLTPVLIGVIGYLTFSFKTRFMRRVVLKPKERELSVFVYRFFGVHEARLKFDEIGYVTEAAKRNDDDFYTLLKISKPGYERYGRMFLSAGQWYGKDLFKFCLNNSEELRSVASIAEKEED